MNSSVPMSALPPGAAVSSPAQSGTSSGWPPGTAVSTPAQSKISSGWPPGAAVSSPAQSGTSNGKPPRTAVSTPAQSGMSSGGPPGTGSSSSPHYQPQPNPPLPGSLPIGSAAPPPGMFRQPGQWGYIAPIDPHYTVQGQYLLPQHMSDYLGLRYQPSPVNFAQEPSRDEAHKQPWRYRGYPSMSMWMASDDDFFVLRRFGALSARVALMLQDQLTRLEEELGKEDIVCRQMPKGDSGTLRYDVRSRRQEILGLALWTLEKYNKFVLDHSQLKARPDASANQIENVKNWLSNMNGPINEKEAAFIEQQGDLFAVVTNPKTPLRRFLDRISFFDAVPCFRPKKLNPTQIESSTTVYDRESLIDKCVTCITICLGLGMLIGPLWWLQHISASQANLQTRLWIITGFIIIFCVGLAMMTIAKPFETLAASAAYAAVLMVFMQIGSTSGA